MGAPQRARVPAPMPSPEPGKARHGGAYLSFRILQVAFIVVPILVGGDKFFHLLVNWDQYLSPAARHVLGPHARLFMRAAGLWEIGIGIGMAIRPQVFAYVASAWILCIVVNLLLTGAFFDVALRDFVLVLSTFSLGPLSRSFAEHEKGG